MIKAAKQWAAKIVAHLKDIVSAFFDLQEEESIEEKGKKVAVTTARRVAYAVADYWLAVLEMVLIVTMKAYGYEFLYIFLATWAFGVIVAGIFVVIWQRTGNDLTLGEDYRRAVDVIILQSRFAGMLSIGGVLIKASFWDGPEHIVIFFQKEIKTEARIALALLVLTVSQAILWTTIYSLGYDSISELVNYFRST